MTDPEMALALLVELKSVREDLLTANKELMQTSMMASIGVTMVVEIAKSLHADSRLDVKTLNHLREILSMHEMKLDPARQTVIDHAQRHLS